MSNKKITEFTDDELVELAGWPSALEKASAFSGSMAQAELLRRNTEALHSSSKSSERYADRMMGLTLIVGLITFLQLMFSVISSTTSIFEKIVYGIGILGLISFAFWDLKRDLDSSK